MDVVEAITVRFGLFHWCQKGGCNCPGSGWHSLHDTSRTGSWRAGAAQHGVNLGSVSSVMAGPCLSPQPTAKESLSSLESGLQPELPEEVGQGAVLV